MTDIEYYQPTEAERRLIDALRSGEYEQGQGILQREDKLCCLGVACRVSRVELEVKIDSRNVRSFNDEEHNLPDAVREEIGWRDECAGLAFGDRQDRAITLINLNDFDGRTFDQIADVIEAGLVRRAAK